MRVFIRILWLLSCATPVWAQEKGWESNWNEVLAAAKKEGKVAVHAAPDPNVRRELPAKFTARFGIPVEWLTGRSEAAQKLRIERSTGLYTADVFIAGIDTMSQILYPEKMLDPIKPLLLLPDVLDSSKWKKGGVWFSDPERTYVVRLLYYVTPLFFLNTSHVKLEELKSIKDLVNPKWKGRITTMDPTGLASAAVSHLYYFGEEFVKRFYFEQKPVISQNNSQVTDWLARGTYPIAFGASESQVDKFRQDGFPLVAVYSLPDAPGRLSGGSGSVGLMNKAPHPNAARVFINWLFSKQGMEIYSRAQRASTTRSDLDESFLNPEAIPRPGINYLLDAADWDYSTAGKEKIRLRMKQLLGR